MSICKYCANPFAWGNVDGRWVPLVPVGEEGTLDRKYQDENGVLRSGHRDICVRPGGPSVHAVRLARPVPATEIIGKPVERIELIDPETGEVSGRGYP